MTEHDHRKGADGCGVCVAHDHLDVDPFGFDRDQQPVPAWWFTCPRCGTHESQDHVKHWTKAGMAWVKDHPGYVGSNQVHESKAS